MHNQCCKIISHLNKHSLKYLLLAALLVPIGIVIVLLFAWNNTFGISFSGTTATWSNFGSFFGGSFGPILSYFSFLGVLCALYHQQKDSKLIMKNNAINTHSVMLNMFIDFCDRGKLEVNPYKLFNLMFPDVLGEYIHGNKSSENTFVLKLSPSALKKFIDALTADSGYFVTILRSEDRLEADPQNLQLAKIVGFKPQRGISSFEEVIQYLTIAKDSFESALEFPSFYINQGDKNRFIENAKSIINHFHEQQHDKITFYDTARQLNEQKK